VGRRIGQIQESLDGEISIARKLRLLERNGLGRVLIFLSVGLVVWSYTFSEASGQVSNKKVKVVKKFDVREIASLDGMILDAG